MESLAANHSRASQSSKGIGHYVRRCRTASRPASNSVGAGSRSARNRDMNESEKHVLDAASLGTAVATVAGWLPALAAIFTIVWTGIRIYETKTVQHFLRRR